MQDRIAFWRQPLIAGNIRTVSRLESAWIFADLPCWKREAPFDFRGISSRAGAGFGGNRADDRVEPGTDRVDARLMVSGGAVGELRRAFRRVL
ncbi:hypothetical protein FJ959_26995 [Mesorhizobium sp. B2-2-4]|uniref:hypothetical protein n=1 Tax=unclassified Mesorhizobium TaxID=325217 RepID=UPI00112D9E75|nr:MULTISPECIES: hypothetical protein [unclassified Mesorhizobium]TPJ50580.1 hypothetical protein FJ426_24300 [Mesorhizobium sp. B2-6-4]TPK58668.1 hypothetical protein FJ551_26390 [Mesorhizobium sp. B2-5-1]TPL47120.1 hypothetical protein FJ937_21415 [Mesorhizobium sp. B2-4-4]TPM49522.1 hypothetical protein FJ959_26995 [Mesorhizobium sp. B2-2-4]TPM55672.1 hypothetical protein FJ962_25525 [Mesorhizobium sp. B2-1-9]